MELTTFFSTKVFNHHIGQDAEALNKALRADILAWRDEDAEGIVRSNRMDVWHSQPNAHLREAFTPLCELICEMAQHLFAGEFYHRQSFPVITDMWANVSGKGGYHVDHTHAGSLWSGVYYVDAPEGSGGLVIRDPRPQADTWLPVFHGPWQRRPHSLPYAIMTPTPGMMAMWPAWLPHHVEPNEADDTRISISFNIRQEFPEGFDPAAEPKHPPFVLVPAVLEKDDLTRVYAQLAGSAGEMEEGSIGNGVVDRDFRSNAVIFADVDENSPWRWLFDKVKASAAIANETAYGADISGQAMPMQFSFYQGGEEYKAHMDADEDDSGSPAAKRSLSAVVLLRNAQAGGGTAFQRAGDRPVLMDPGDALFFRADEWHRALPVTEGQRDTLVIWFTRA